MITKQCAYCNSSFKVQPSRYDRFKFCSKECRKKGMTGRPNTWQRNGKIVNCTQCNKEIYRGKKRLDRTKLGYFCGFSCYHKYLKGKIIGDNHQSWKENACLSAKHKWLTEIFGKPEECFDCNKKGYAIKNKDGKTRWSIEWSNKDHKYSRQVVDYTPRCRKCHDKFDRDNKLKYY
jgi:hypothetical protein